MRLKKTCCLNSICTFAITLATFGAFATDAWGQSQNQASNSQALAPIKSDGPTVEKPYKMTSRIHLQKGTNRGYLIVQVDLLKGSHIYSLTQKGSVTPSKIKVTPNDQFRIGGKFSPDQPATVVENDPDFNHRIEKHKGKIQFFAPIEIAPGVDVTKLNVDLTFDGLVCSGNNCRPVMGHKFKGGFAGYFERTAAQQAPAQNSGTLIR